MNKKANTPGRGKVIVQWIISIVLVYNICFMLVYSVGLIFDSMDNDEYSWMLSDINEGNYADFADTYWMTKELGKNNDAKYARFDEFALFYREYIWALTYRQAKEPEKYQDKFDNALDKMKEIYQNSSHMLNAPHYEYLIESLMVE